MSNHQPAGELRTVHRVLSPLLEVKLVTLKRIKRNANLKIGKTNQLNKLFQVCESINTMLKRTFRGKPFVVSRLRLNESNCRRFSW